MSNAALRHELSTDDNVPLLAATAAAQRLGVCRDTLLALVERGELRCARDSANRRLFTAADIRRVSERRAQAGAGAKG
jgi:excisionase family DNA binding protein